MPGDGGETECEKDIKKYQTTKTMKMKNSALTFVLILIFFVLSIAQSDRKEEPQNMDTIPVLVFSPGDSVYIDPNAFFYYDNEKVVNGPEVWQLPDFSIKYYLVPHLEEKKVAHSDDWFSQQRLAEYLSTLPQEDFDQFVKTYLFKESDFEELGESKLK